MIYCAATELAKVGFKVTVIAGMPNYPSGTIPPNGTIPQPPTTELRLPLVVKGAAPAP